MLEIEDSRIKKFNGKFHAECLGCKKEVAFAYKDSALRMLSRGNCRSCKRDYRSVMDQDFKIYRNAFGRWCSICSGCNKEQAYTRKSHAQQSSLNDSQCRKCAQEAKGFSSNKPVGDELRVYHKFKKSAKGRGLEFTLSQDEFYADYDGKCRLTGWSISLRYGEMTASVDRVDNEKGYVKGNIQWVHSRVNMARGKVDLEKFIDLCKAVAKHSS